MEGVEIQAVPLLQQSLQQPSMAGSVLSSIGTVGTIETVSWAGIEPLPLKSTTKSVTVLETVDQLIVGNRLTTSDWNQSSLVGNANIQAADPLLGLSDQSMITGMTEDAGLNEQLTGGIGKDSMSQIDNDLQQLEELFDTAAQLEQVKALDDLRSVASPGLEASLDFDLGKTPERGSTIGQIPFGGDSALPPDNTGFDDPLNGHRSSRPASTVVGAGSIPGATSLVSHDHGEPVWQPDRHSDDGRTTYSHGSYADGARVAQRTHRHEDGSTTTTSMIWGSDGRVEEYEYSSYDHKTGHVVTETTRMNPDGTETVVGKEVDENGETVRTWGNDGLEAKDLTKTASSVDPDSSTGGSNVNPLTGQYIGKKPKTSNDQVNPNPDAPELTGSRLNFDSRKLVVNPPLDATMGKASFDPNRFASPNQVKPPQPEF